jgi:hypothetical protein
MAYQPINIPGRSPAKQLDVQLEEPKEPEPEKLEEVEVEEEAKEPEVKEEVQVDLDEDSVVDDDDSDDDEEEQQQQKPKKEKLKKKAGRPKGSTNKKRDKRIQQLLEEKKREAEKAAALETKLEELERKSYETTRASTASRKKALETNLESLQAQLKNAIEDDDAAAIVDIQSKMMQANMEYASVAYEYDNTPEEYQAPPKQQKQPEASPYALEWIDEHPEFNQDEEFHAAALGVNAKLLKLGFDPESPEFYEELDKRLSKRWNEYYDISDSDVVQYKEDDESNDSESDDIPQTVAGASRTPTGSTSGVKAQSGRKRKNTVILTESDQILCQKWGIDPVAFAKRKKALEGKEKGDYTDIGKKR